MDSHNDITNIKENRGRRRDSPPEAMKASSEADRVDLDWVLENELGQFGRFQLINLLLISIPLIATGFNIDYIFTVAAVPHRCLILECGETFETAIYNQESLAAAFPRHESCKRFSPIRNNGTLEYCPGSLFDEHHTIDCDKLVYENHNSVVYEFNLGCQTWLRVLAGVLCSIGTLLALPVTGYVSDRWGRKTALVINIFNSAAIALIRAFSINYTMFLIMELMQTTLGSGIFSSAFILATEMVGPKYRVVSGVICSMMFAFGLVVVGCVAWVVQFWRHLIMVLYIPTFLLMSYYWLLSESVRWLLSKKKYDTAKLILEKVARTNRTQISEKSVQALMAERPLSIEKNQEPSVIGLIKTIVKSRVMLRRVCTTPVWWIAVTFIYYGLSINSTTLSATNMYLNYILTCAIEIPGFIAAVLVLDRLGRKFTLSCGFFLSAICNIVVLFMPENMPTLSLVVFLVGKCSISAAMTSIYLFTSELYPTVFRHTLVAFSSMIGRLGLVLAPVMPLLAEYWSGLPNALFGAMGVVAGVLVLTQPETLGSNLPDTLAEAEALGCQTKRDLIKLTTLSEPQASNGS